MAARSPWPIIGLVGGVGLAGLVGLVGAAVALREGRPMSAEAVQIANAYGLPPVFSQGIADTARAVGTHPYWLADLLYHESGLTFSPKALNEASDAAGILQWTPKTLERMSAATGVPLDTETILSMSRMQQLPWVRYYLEWTASGLHPDDPRPVPLDTPQRLFMSVFFPPARDVPPTMRFADIDHPLADRVTPNNPGKVTPADYIAEVFSHGKLSGLVPQGGSNG